MPKCIDYDLTINWFYCRCFERKFNDLISIKPSLLQRVLETFAITAILLLYWRKRCSVNLEHKSVVLGLMTPSHFLSSSSELILKATFCQIKTVSEIYFFYLFKKQWLPFEDQGGLAIVPHVPMVLGSNEIFQPRQTAQSYLK